MHNITIEGIGTVQLKPVAQDFSITKDSLRCIDGRDPDPDQVAGPGGGLGLVMAVVAAAHDVDSGADLAKVASVIEGELGGMSWHTDDHASADAIACAGCGHCNGIVSLDTYGTDAKLRDFLLQYIEDKKSDAVITVHTGDHDEKAVLVVVDEYPNYTIQSCDPNRETPQVFVFHQGLWFKTIEKMVETLAGSVLNVDKDKLAERAKEVALKQLLVSVERLAQNMPLIALSGPAEAVITQKLAPNAGEWASQQLQSS